MPNEFAGRCAVVTGGGSGIGLSSALELHRRGARVAVLDMNVAGVPESVVGYSVDVRSREQVDAAVSAAGESLGGIDIVVNCAGIPSRGSFESLSDEEWAAVYDVNVMGMVRVTRASLPFLTQSSDASIVNLCSVSANVGLAGISAYSASKGAIRALTRSLAVELLPQRVRVNSISPGTVDTPWIRSFFAQLPDPTRAEAAAHMRQPTGRMVEAEEVAAAVCYLAGPLARSITGADLAVDGGMSTLRVE